MTTLRKQIRIEQTLADIERLRSEFDRWLKRRSAADNKGQYKTQLQALDTVINKALKDIENDTGNILQSSLTTGEVYSQCRLQEKRTLWVQRVLWGYYQQKFDQRDQSDELKKLLEAADDVVWSCYKEAFQNAAAIDNTFKTLQPIPLAYVEPFYSPQALPRNEPPGILKETRLGDRFLVDFFSQLPIPLVSLPPACIDSPWWLVYLSHEVGHHVQHDLGLVRPFSQQLLNLAMSAPEPIESRSEAERWYKWGQEIFADIFSLYVMGASAVRAMAELETHPDIDTLMRKDNYPSPVVRLTLLGKMAAKLGLQAPTGVQPLAAETSSAGDLMARLQQEMAADLKMLDKIVEALSTASLAHLGTWADLSGWSDSDFTSYGEVYDWQESLLNPALNKYNPSLQAARLIISAAVGAWENVVQLEPDATRKEALKQLNQEVLGAIERNRDKETRAADPVANQDVGTIAADISQQLRQAEFNDWF
jgi:hypothetical protein